MFNTSMVRKTSLEEFRQLFWSFCVYKSIFFTLHESLLSHVFTQCPLTLCFDWERHVFITHISPHIPRKWVLQLWVFSVQSIQKLHVKWQCFHVWHFCKYTKEVSCVSAIHGVSSHVFVSCCCLFTHTVNQSFHPLYIFDKVQVVNF